MMCKTIPTKYYLMLRKVAKRMPCNNDLTKHVFDMVSKLEICSYKEGRWFYGECSKLKIRLPGKTKELALDKLCKHITDVIIVETVRAPFKKKSKHGESK